MDFFSSHTPPPTAIDEPPWTRALTYCVATTVIALLLDFGLVKHLVPNGARYFVLHVCFNSWLTSVVLSDSLVVLQKPSEALLGDGDKGGWADSAVVTTAGVTSSAPRTQLARFQ